MTETNGAKMNNDKKSKTKYLKLIGNVLVIIALIFLVRKFYLLDIDISNYYSKNNVFIALILFLIFSILLSLQSLPWVKIVRRICGIKLPFLDGNIVYCKSSLYKYIPGNVFQYIGRGSIVYQFKGINYSSVISSIIIETMCVVISSIIVSLIFCWNTVIDYLLKRINLLIVILAFIILIILLLIIFRYRIIQIIQKHKIIINSGLIIDIIFSILYFSFILFIQGIMLTVIINQIDDTVLFKNMLTVIGIYSFSWLVGYLTPGASGGIGVRETLLCLVLGHYYPESIILISVVIFRILNIVSDLGAYLISLLMKNIKKNISKETNVEA